MSGNPPSKSPPRSPRGVIPAGRGSSSPRGAKSVGKGSAPPSPVAKSRSIGAVAGDDAISPINSPRGQKGKGKGVSPINSPRGKAPSPATLRPKTYSPPKSPMAKNNAGDAPISPINSPRGKIMASPRAATRAGQAPSLSLSSPRAVPGGSPRAVPAGSPRGKSPGSPVPKLSMPMDGASKSPPRSPTNRGQSPMGSPRNTIAAGRVPTKIGSPRAQSPAASPRGKSPTTSPRGKVTFATAASKAAPTSARARVDALPKTPIAGARGDLSPPRSPQHSPRGKPGGIVPPGKPMGSPRIKGSMDAEMAAFEARQKRLEDNLKDVNEITERAANVVTSKPTAEVGITGAIANFFSGAKPDAQEAAQPASRLENLEKKMQKLQQLDTPRGSISLSKDDPRSAVFKNLPTSPIASAQQPQTMLQSMRTTFLGAPSQTELLERNRLDLEAAKRFMSTRADLEDPEIAMQNLEEIDLDSPRVATNTCCGGRTLTEKERDATTNFLGMRDEPEEGNKDLPFPVLFWEFYPMFSMFTLAALGIIFLGSAVGDGVRTLDWIAWYDPNRHSLWITILCAFAIGFLFLMFDLHEAFYHFDGWRRNLAFLLVPGTLTCFIFMYLFSAPWVPSSTLVLSFVWVPVMIFLARKSFMRHWNCRRFYIIVSAALFCSGIVTFGWWLSWDSGNTGSADKFHFDLTAPYGFTHGLQGVIAARLPNVWRAIATSDVTDKTHICPPNNYMHLMYQNDRPKSDTNGRPQPFVYCVDLDTQQSTVLLDFDLRKKSEDGGPEMCEIGYFLANNFIGEISYSHRGIATEKDQEQYRVYNFALGDRLRHSIYTSNEHGQLVDMIPQESVPIFRDLWYNYALHNCPVMSQATFLMWASPIIYSVYVWVLSLWSLMLAFTVYKDGEREDFNMKLHFYIICVAFAFFLFFVGNSAAGISFALGDALMNIGFALCLLLSCSAYVTIDRHQIHHAIKHHEIPKFFIHILNSDWTKAFVTVFGAIPICALLFLSHIKKRVNLQYPDEELHRFDSTHFCKHGHMLLARIGVRWNWSSILHKANIICMSLLVWQVVMTKTLWVFIAFIKDDLMKSDSLPGSVCRSDDLMTGTQLTFAFIGVGVAVQQIPMVSSYIIYLLGGIMLTNRFEQEGMHFYGSIILVALICLFLRMIVISIHYQIGQFLFRSMNFQAFIGAHKATFRALEKVFLRGNAMHGLFWVEHGKFHSGFSLRKSVCWIGLPEWPVNLLCGMIKIDNQEHQLASSLSIFVILPGVAAGAFLLRIQQAIDHVDNQCVIPDNMSVWPSYVAGAAFVSMFILGACFVYGVHSVAKVLEEHDHELHFPLKEHWEIWQVEQQIKVKKDAWTFAEIVVNQREGHTYLTTAFFFQLLAVIACYCAGQSLFRPFDIASHINTPIHAGGLDGNAANIITPAGWVFIGFWIVGSFCWYRWLWDMHDVADRRFQQLDAAQKDRDLSRESSTVSRKSFEYQRRLTKKIEKERSLQRMQTGHLGGTFIEKEGSRQKVVATRFHAPTEFVVVKDRSGNLSRQSTSKLEVRGLTRSGTKKLESMGINISHTDIHLEFTAQGDDLV